MKISQLILAQLWLYAFFLGAGLGAVYDAFSITRVFLGVPFTPRIERFLNSAKSPLLRRFKVKRHPKLCAVIGFIEDFIFSVCAACALILLCYQMDDGNVRIPIIFCALAGFWGYRKTLGSILRTCTELLLLIGINLLHYAVYYLILPIRRLLYAFRRGLLRLWRREMRKWERKQRIRYTKSEEHRLQNTACGML